MLEAVISLFSENIQGVGALTSTPDIRKFLAKSSHNYECEKCGVIQKHLAPRAKEEEKQKPAPFIAPSLSLERPMSQAGTKEEK